MDSKVKFLTVDNPHATPLTIHILSAVAQDEAQRISTRIKEGLAQS
jgi:DNA invertase Pin-like site-specific DNA recombinase